MEIQIDGHAAGAAGGLLAGIAALWGTGATWLRRQRKDGERMGRLEQAVETNTTQIGQLRTDMQAGFAHLEDLIIGSK